MCSKSTGNHNYLSSLVVIIFSLFVFIAYFASFQALANEFISEKEHYDSLVKKFQLKTMDELIFMANEGNTDAQLLLGLWHLKGVQNHTPVNIDLAEKWLLKSAENKNPYAELNLAYMELYTKSEPNLMAAEKRLINSARAGVVEAQYMLANIYYTMLKDKRKEAFYWYHKAAKKGHIPSAYDLGYMFFLGEVVEKNVPAAIYWFEIAAENGHEGAIKKLGYMYLHGSGVEQNFYKANQYFERSQYSLSSEYQEDMGRLFSNFKSYDYSLNWFLKAAQNGSIESQSIVGSLYYNGGLINKNINEAVKWFTKAAENGHADSQYMLGNIYEDGKGVLQDYRVAYKWYYRAAINKNTAALFKISIMYRDGKLGEKNLIKSHAWANICALNEDDYCSEIMKNISSQMSEQDVLEAQDLAKDILNEINNKTKN